MAETSEIRNTTNCTICLGNLIKPKILPCSHSFCEICISEYIVSTVTQPGQNHFNCPVCRTSVETEDPMMEKSKWVSFLPSKSDHEVSEAFRETKNQLCHPCQRLEKKINACLWCCDCNEALCQSCCDLHRNFKFLATHKTVSIETEGDLESEIDKILPAFDDFCSIHEGRRLEMYCKTHTQAICIQCLSTDHRKCENLEMIDSIDRLKEEGLNEFKNEIVSLLDAVKTLTKEKTQSKQILQTKFTSVESQALGVITQLKIKLDDLYIEFLKQTGLKQDELQDKIDQTLKSLSEYSVVLEEMINNTELLTRYGSKVQVLRMTNEIKSNLGAMGSNLYPLLSNSSEYKVDGNFNTILNTFSDITDIGTILIAEENRESTFTEEVQKFQDLLISNAKVEFSTVALKPSSILKFPGKTVKSSVHLDNEMCLVATTNDLLVVLRSSNEIIYTLHLKYTPKKLCFDEDKKILYGTNYDYAVFYCNVNGKQLEGFKTFSFGTITCRVAICDGNVYILKVTGILETQDFENQNKWMETHCESNSDISFDEKTNRFAFLKSRRLEFGNIQDKRMRPFAGNSEIKNPQNLAFGPSGLLFVAANQNLIHVISEDEKNLKTLSPGLQTFGSISDITVSRDKKKLYVSCRDCVAVFDIVNKETVK